LVGEEATTTLVRVRFLKLATLIAKIIVAASVLRTDGVIGIEVYWDCSSRFGSLVEPYEDVLVSVLVPHYAANFEDKPYMHSLYCTYSRELASNRGYHYLENEWCLYLL
jgi:hypothetical protein